MSEDKAKSPYTFRQFFDDFGIAGSFIASAVALVTALLWFFDVLPTVTGALFCVALGAALFGFVGYRTVVSRQPLMRILETDSDPPQAKPEAIRPTLKANIVLWNDNYDEYVEIDDYGLFREVDVVSPDTVRALGFVLCNEPRPPAKIGSIDNIEAEISFCDPDLPNAEPYHRIRECCWVDEEWWFVSLGVNDTQKLIVAILDEHLTFGYAENRAKRNDRPKQTFVQGLKRIRIKVWLTGGDNKEWERRVEYDLDIPNEMTFTFQRIR